MSEQNIALAPGRDPYSAYGKEKARTQQRLKYSKGFWVLGSGPDAVDVKIGTRVAVNMPGLRVGFIKWKDNKPVEERMVSVGSGLPRYKRVDLGDTDKSIWPIDEQNGQPRDPWQETSTIPVLNLERDEDWIFSTSSKGGNDACGALSLEYSLAYRQHEGQTPIVELGTDSYPHPNKSFGRVHFPVLKIVDWIDNPDGGEAQPDLLAHETGTVEDVEAGATAGDSKVKPLF